jgi:hypothetical protein
VLALWVTNDPRVLAFAAHTLLPAWGFTHESTWWWLKVAGSGQPICPTGGTHKNPYERIIIGYRSAADAASASASASASVVDSAPGYDWRPAFDRDPAIGVSELFAQGVAPELADRITPLAARPFPYAAPPPPAPLPVSMHTAAAGAGSGSGGGATATATATATTTEQLSGPAAPAVPWRCIVSAPLRHSWKPPLHNILSEIMAAVPAPAPAGSLPLPPGDPKDAPGGETAGLSAQHSTLEIFARWGGLVGGLWLFVSACSCASFLACL